MNEKDSGFDFDKMDSHGKEGVQKWLREKYRSPEEIECLKRRLDEQRNEKW